MRGDQPGTGEVTRFGLPTATALVVGTVIGVGVFNLPTSLAAFGPISLVSMALTTIGALALALLFAALARRIPTGGGPYAYVRAAFGNRLGFASAWSYWITAWAGNAAIAVGWVRYLEVFVNTGHDKRVSVLLVLVGVWVPVAINLVGVRSMGSVQVLTTILKYAALVLMSTVGLLFLDLDNYSPANVSGRSTMAAIGGGMAVALFSYIGVEAASVAAGKVRNPDRNVPRATVLGTTGTAVVYLLSLIVVFGLLPTSELAASTAPYSDAANAMAGGTWAGSLMAIAVIVSGFGALNGWTMICAEVPRTAAAEGLFPERFQRLSTTGVPAFGIVVSAVLASVAVLVNFLGSAGASAFTTLVLMTGITAAIPYGLSALAQLRWRLTDRRSRETPGLVRDLTVAAVSLVFSVLFIWYSRDTAASFWVSWAPFLLAGAALLIGIPVYRAQRPRMTRPASLPPTYRMETNDETA